MSTRTQRWPIIGIAPRQFVGDGRHGNKHRTVEIAQLDVLLNALRPIVVGQRRLANRHQIHLASTKQGLGLLCRDDGTVADHRDRYAALGDGGKARAFSEGRCTGIGLSDVQIV